MRQDKHSSIHEEKGKKKLKWCKGTPPPTGRVIPSHFWSNTTSPKILSAPFSLLSLTVHTWNAEFDSAIQVVTLPIPAHPGPSLRGQSETKRKPWQCASAAQQEPKHSCAINTVLATNPKHIPIPAAMKNINSIPAGLSTTAHSHTD